MAGSFEQENNAIASWFYGPRGENSKFIHEFFGEIIKRQDQSRYDYFSDDSPFITENNQNSVEFKNNISSMRYRLDVLSNTLAEKTIPFWSPRYMGHMSMESSMPGNLGYIAALMYNQNNAAVEGSPLTTWLETYVGKQLCEMLGFDVQWNLNENISSIDMMTLAEKQPKIQGWGHITCGGSVANLESIWAARNLKYYPLSLRMAIDDGPLSFIGSSFIVELADSKIKLFKDCSTWELLNLKPSTILDIPDQLYSGYGITPQFLQNVLNKYSIQTVGKDYIENKFKITKPAVYFASMTMHYSWPKGCAIVGIGSNNIIPVPVDNTARMDMNELDKLLAQCVKNKQAIYAVVAIIGSTEHGACDPLSGIIELRKKYEINHGLSFVIHADAAWGGYFRSMLIEPPTGSHSIRRRKGLEKENDSFMPKLALKNYTEKQLNNLKYCDSVTIDPHKSGYVPYPAGGLCYRDQRMRYLVTWTSPIIIRTNEESIGIYGVEGSKPGAASAATWLSHDTIGLHQKGYGLLLGRANFSCAKIHCHWATMSTEEDNFIVTPFNMLPAEKLSPPDSKAVKEQKESIRTLIVEKSSNEIIENDYAKKLIKEVGSDIMVNAFACNFKVNGKLNEDIYEANYLNRRLYEKFSFATSKGSNLDKPLILTSTQFKEKNYGNCLKNFKNRLGLKGDQDLYVLVNTIMSPWNIEVDFLNEMLEKTFKNALKDVVKLSIIRNKLEPDHHAFIMQGTDKIYFTLLPMFQKENHRQQLIFTADLPKLVLRRYLKARKLNPSHVYFLGNKDKMTLDDIGKNGNSFKASIYRDFNNNKGSTVWIKDFQVTNVRVLKKRHLATKFQDSEYPENHMPFYIYGTENQLHIDHMHLKFPSIQLSADCVELNLVSGELTKTQRENGVIAHVTDVHEISMQPFPEINPFPQTKNTDRTKDPFFFQNNCTFQVELYEDPMTDPYQNGPGLNNVNDKKPIAKGTIRLPPKNKGCLYIDTCMINMDPTADKKVNNGKVTNQRSDLSSKNHYQQLFEQATEVHWYEENKLETKKHELELDSHCHENKRRRII